MRPKIWPLLAMLWLSACAATPETGGLAGFCAGISDPAGAHTEALLADGGPRSTVTGAALLAGVDAACRR